MIDIGRELIAYFIIGVLLLAAVPYAISMRWRRYYEKLRRRGIKRHGH